MVCSRYQCDNCLENILILIRRLSLGNRCVRASASCLKSIDINFITEGQLHKAREVLYRLIIPDTKISVLLQDSWASFSLSWMLS